MYLRPTLYKNRKAKKYLLHIESSTFVILLCVSSNLSSSSSSAGGGGSSLETGTCEKKVITSSARDWGGKKRGLGGRPPPNSIVVTFHFPDIRRPKQNSIIARCTDSLLFLSKKKQETDKMVHLWRANQKHAKGTYKCRPPLAVAQFSHAP